MVEKEPHAETLVVTVLGTGIAALGASTLAFMEALRSPAVDWRSINPNALPVPVLCGVYAAAIGVGLTAMGLELLLKREKRP